MRAVYVSVHDKIQSMTNKIDSPLARGGYYLYGSEHDLKFGELKGQACSPKWLLYLINALLKLL